MSYDIPEDRSCICRLALFLDSPVEPPEDPRNPGEAKTGAYHAFFFDLCRTDAIPRKDWRKPGQNSISVTSLRRERIAVQFKDDVPLVASVYKWEYETKQRADFVHRIKDVDGLVIFQDVGTSTKEDTNFEQRMLEILGVVVRAKNIDPATINPGKFPIPVIILTAAFSGRVSNRSRKNVEKLAKEADWAYSYVSNLHHEEEIAEGIVDVVAEIEKRAIYPNRLVPGVPTPKIDPPPLPPKKTPSAPKQTPAAPAMPETPANQTAERRDDDTPADAAVITPGDPLGALPAFPEPPKTVSRGGTPKPTARPSPGVRPPLPTSSSMGSLPTSGSKRSVRPKNPGGPSSFPRDFTNPVYKPGPPSTPSLGHYNLPPSTSSSSTAPPRPRRPATPNFDGMDIDVPLPRITTIDQGPGSFMEAVDRYRNPPRPHAPAPTTTAAADSNAPEYFFDMEGAAMRAQREAEEAAARAEAEARAAAEEKRKGASGLWGMLKTLSKGKGKQRRSSVSSDTFDPPSFFPPTSVISSGSSLRSNAAAGPSTILPLPNPLDIPPPPPARTHPLSDALANTPAPPAGSGRSNRLPLLPGQTRGSPAPALGGSLHSSDSRGNVRAAAAEEAHRARMYKRFGSPVGEQTLTARASEMEIEEPEIEAKKRACCVMM